MSHPGFDTVLDSCLRVRPGEEVLLLFETEVGSVFVYEFSCVAKS